MKPQIALIIAIAGQLTLSMFCIAKDAKSIEEQIQGTWKLVSLKVGGEQAPPEIVATLKMTFKDNTLIVSPSEPGYSKYTYKLDLSIEPTGFRIIRVEGENDEKPIAGTCTFEDNKLKICLSRVANRPVEFITASGLEPALYVLTRDNP